MGTGITTFDRATVSSKTNSFNWKTRWCIKFTLGIICDPLHELSNGIISCDKDLFGHEATCVFVCDIGFERIGNEQLTCIGTNFPGNWDGDSPICKRKNKFLE